MTPQRLGSIALAYMNTALMKRLVLGQGVGGDLERACHGWVW